MSAKTFAAIIAAAASLALPNAAAHAKSTVVSAASYRHGVTRLRYAPAPSQHGRRSGLVALVGDRESGLGFYALPAQYRTRIPARSRQGNAIRYAVATEVGSYEGSSLGEESGRRPRVFNPVDGYGTPFFAGYYGPAGDPDDDHGPLGQAYD